MYRKIDKIWQINANHVNCQQDLECLFHRKEKGNFFRNYWNNHRRENDPGCWEKYPCFCKLYISLHVYVLHIFS